MKRSLVCSICAGICFVIVMAVVSVYIPARAQVIDDDEYDADDDDDYRGAWEDDFEFENESDDYND